MLLFIYISSRFLHTHTHTYAFVYVFMYVYIRNFQFNCPYQNNTTKKELIFDINFPKNT